MKFVFPFLIILLTTIFSSCGSGKKEQKSVGTTPAESKISQSDFNFDTLKGLYRGDFGDATISLNLTFISENHATGYNIVKGNKRNVSGKIYINGKEIIMHLNEPGDDKTDGIFTLYVDTNNLSSITGEWQSQSGEIKTVSLTRNVVDWDDEKYFGKYNQVYSDSIGDLTFDVNGSCTYDYYLNKGLPTEQAKQVKGSWKFTPDIVTVFWQQNSVFPNRKSVFRFSLMHEDEDYDSHKLEGEGRQFTELMY